MQANKVGICILAAGASSRLGRPKQLVEFQGKYLLQQAIDCSITLETYSVCVVLAKESQEIQERIAFSSCQLLINQSPEEGIASSIRIGCEFFHDKEVDAILFLVSDQAYLQSKHLLSLIQSHQAGRITASSYANTYGVPLILSRQFFSSCLELKGDKGAKAICLQFPELLDTVEFPHGEIDIDTPEDIIQLDQNQSTMQVNIRYFGQIAETLNKTEESMLLPSHIKSVEEFKHYCIQQYPEIQSQPFQIALNAELNQQELIQEYDELALLPPFAGG